MPNRQDMNRYARRQAQNLAFHAASGAAKRAYRQYANRQRFAPVGAPFPTMAGRYKHKSKYYKKRSRKTSMKKQIRDLQRDVNQDLATHTHKKSFIQFITCNENSAGYGTLEGWNINSLETALGNFRYYNPAIPGTLTTADGSTGTYSRKFHFTSLYSKVELRSASRVPVKVSAYLLTPKQDTGIEPHTAMTGGLTDQANPSNTSILINPSDSEEFNSLWSIRMCKKFVLGPEGTRTLKWSSRDVTYDPSKTDAHNLKYQKQFKNCVWYFRIQGTTSYDLTQASGQVGTNYGAVAIHGYTKLVCKYDAGTSLNDITVDTSGLSTFTNYATQFMRDQTQVAGN